MKVEPQVRSQPDTEAIDINVDHLAPRNQVEEKDDSSAHERERRTLLRSRVLVGIGALTLANVLDAVREVVSARWITRINPATLIFLVFIVATACFSAVHKVFPDGGTGRSRLPPQALRDVVWLNLTTAISWFAFFHALRGLEPAVVAALMGAGGPVFLWLANRKLRPDAPAHWVDAVTAGGISGAATLLFIVRLAQSDTTSMLRLAEALASSIVAAASTAGTGVFLKRLLDRNVTSRSVMAHRFYGLLLLAGAWSFLYDDPFSVLVHEGPRIAALSLFSVVAPLALIQTGVRRCEPMTVMAMLSAGPVFTLGVQLFDDRLSVSLSSWVCVLAICGFAFHNGYEHARTAR